MLLSDVEAAADTVCVDIVEDDGPCLEALQESLTAQGVPIRAFRSAEEFLHAPRPDSAFCLIVDEKLPGLSGAGLVRQLNEHGKEAPFVFLTAFATTQLTVEAMRLGAVTVLDKPCSGGVLLDAVAEARRRAAEHHELREAKLDAQRRVELLSPREREVLEMVLEGTPNKQIASRLNVCVRTIEARRSKIYQAMGVTSLASLVRMSMLAGVV